MGPLLEPQLGLAREEVWQLELGLAVGQQRAAEGAES